MVENRAGAGGTLGSAIVAQARSPTATRMLVHSSAHTITPALYSKLGYDIVRDFVTVGAIGSVPNVMIIAPSKGFKTVQDYREGRQGRSEDVELCLARCRLRRASERGTFPAERRVSMPCMIPFKGGAEGLTEVIAGRVDFYFCPIATALPHVKEGRLLGARGVEPAARRRVAGDSDHAGIRLSSNSDYTFWMGIFMPAKTPPAIVARLHAELVKALDTPSVKEQLAKLGVEPMPLSAEQFDAQVKSEVGDLCGVRQEGRPDGELKRYSEKLVPQPQEALAFGLLTLNDAPIRSSTKSISEPAR